MTLLEEIVAFSKNMPALSIDDIVKNPKLSSQKKDFQDFSNFPKEKQLSHCKAFFTAHYKIISTLLESSDEEKIVLGVMFEEIEMCPDIETLELIWLAAKSIFDTSGVSTTY